MKKVTNTLAPALQDFFTKYLPESRGLSRHTLLSYRDTLVLLLRFVAGLRNKTPVTLELDAISPEAVLAFLNHLEEERHNKTSSRNVRLAAIHAFFRYITINMPESIDQAQRILAIPFKRTVTRPIDYLEYEELHAVLSNIDRATRDGRRDYALLALMFNSGARAQEIVDLSACDLQLESPKQVKLFGKGRKTRICPLWPQTAQVLKEFVSERMLEGNTWCGQRDRVMLATLYNTGARVSELIGLTTGSVVLEGSACVHLHGKGRKQRTVPLWRTTASQLRQWLQCHPRAANQPLFPNRAGGPMTRTGVTDRLKLAVTTAAKRFPELKKRHISPHTIRHSTAMHLLQSGVDLTVIALWLGHESTATTHVYVEADLAMKESALNALRAPTIKSKRFRPTEGILAFLEGL